MRISSSLPLRWFSLQRICFLRSRHVYSLALSLGFLKAKRQRVNEASLDLLSLLLSLSLFLLYSTGYLFNPFGLVS